MLDDETRFYFPTSGAVEMPLLFEPQLLRCRAAGPAGDWLTVLIDTGTDPSAIDLRLAQRLGLRLGEFGLGQDAASNSVPFTETVIPWLRLGDLYLRNLFALALDLRAAPFKVDIVLGYNVLWQVVLHVDYVRRILRLCHPDLGTSVSPTGALLPLTFFEHFPALHNTLQCDDLPLPMATIDTGSNGGLTLGPDLAAQVGLHNNASATVWAQGAGFASGPCDILCGQVASLRLGPFDLQQIDLDTPGEGTGDLRRSGRANIGNRLLSRFSSVTLDYVRGLCAFEQ
jgi:hypothetical protein